MTHPTMPELEPLDDNVLRHLPDFTKAMIRSYALAYGELVREACAKVAEQKSARMPHYNDFLTGYANGRTEAARAIRSMGSKGNG